MELRPFTISLQIHHVSRNLHYLTEALATKPSFCMTAGQQVGAVLRKTSVWHGALFQGARPEFERALEDLLTFVKAKQDVLGAFAGEEGMLEVIVTFCIDAAAARAGELAHSVNLHPFLLYELSSRQIGVKVQTAYDEVP
jgi:hypothetical protein